MLMPDADPDFETSFFAGGFFAVIGLGFAGVDCTIFGFAVLVLGFASVFLAAFVDALRVVVAAVFVADFLAGFFLVEVAIPCVLSIDVKPSRIR